MEHVFDARGMIQIGVVRGVNDAGAVQRVTVETTEGYVYDRVEVLQASGFASAPPAAGAIVALFAVGGDPANMRALPVSNPARRFGNLAPGETVVYGADGSRVAIRNGGTVEVLAATTVIISAPNVTIQADALTVVSGGALSLTAPGGLLVAGNVEVAGDIHATGTILGT